MSFEIYFDESNKLDKQEGTCSYYGIIGWDYSNRKIFEQFMKDHNINQELHFVEFKLDKVDHYLKAMEFALDKIQSNFYIVNKQEAFEMADKIGINEEMLRKLFYIKLPERLIYGMTRKIEEYKNIDIYIDKSDEYGNDAEEIVCNDEFIKKVITICHSDVGDKEKQLKDHINKLLNHIQLPDTLKSQLNAQSLYRALNYSVQKVKQVDSKESKSLQVIDVLLGMIKFLYEEEYLELKKEITENEFNNFIKNPLLDNEDIEFLKRNYQKKKNNEKYYLKIVGLKDQSRSIEINKKLEAYSQKSIQRSEFIYRILKNEDMFNRMCNFQLYLWESESVVKDLDYNINKNSKEVIRHDLSRHIAKFLKFKTQYDTKNRLKILENIKNKEDISVEIEREIRKSFGFGSNLKKLMRRYIEELKVK